MLALILNRFHATSTRLRLLVGLGGALTAVSLPAADSPVGFQGNLDIVIPSPLKSLLIENPHVLFKVDIGDDGTLFDVMAIGSPHRDLIPSATKAILGVKFIPAVENGTPVRKRVYVYVNFFDPEQQAWKSGMTGLPFGGNVSDGVQRRIYQTSKQSFVYGESELKDLDLPLKNLHPTRTIYAGQDGTRHTGRCLVEFYVGPSGRARFPTAIESDSDEISINAALTLMKSRFIPPRRDGHPTYIKTQQEFIFK